MRQVKVVHSIMLHHGIVLLLKFIKNFLCFSSNIASVLSDGGLYAIQLTLSYLLMLVFMTFNVWLCFAVIIGEVLARITLTFLFPKLEQLSNTFLTTETCCG